MQSLNRNICPWAFEYLSWHKVIRPSLALGWGHSSESVVELSVHLGVLYVIIYWKNNRTTWAAKFLKDQIFPMSRKVSSLGSPCHTPSRSPVSCLKRARITWSASGVEVTIFASSKPVKPGSGCLLPASLSILKQDHLLAVQSVIFTKISGWHWIVNWRGIEPRTISVR